MGRSTFIQVAFESRQSNDRVLCASIVESACMDSSTIDVTAEDESPGDEIVMIGYEGQNRLNIDEAETEIGAVPREVLCRLGCWFERIYTSHDS